MGGDGEEYDETDESDYGAGVGGTGTALPVTDKEGGLSSVTDPSGSLQKMNLWRKLLEDHQEKFVSQQGEKWISMR